MRWLVFEDLAAAQDRALSLGSELGYPSLTAPNTGSPPITVSHPDGRAAVGVTSSGWSWSSGLLVDVADLLSAAERDSLIDPPDMLSDGWAL